MWFWALRDQLNDCINTRKVMSYTAVNGSQLEMHESERILRGGEGEIQGRRSMHCTPVEEN